MEILQPKWRWKHLYYIRSEEGIVKIRQRPDQTAIDDLFYPAFFNKQRLDLIILKNRQRGTSTKCNLLCLDCTAYYPGKVANTLADTRERASNMFDNVVKLAWDKIPDGLKPKADKDNVNALDFTDSIGSKYIVSASKSEPVDILHVSEAPYFSDDGRITEAEQMLRRNGIEIMESCVTGDTLVQTDAGLVPILSLVPDPKRPGFQPINVKVLGRNGFHQATHAFVNGRKETRILTTKCGYQIEATLNHPLLTLCDGELRWKAVGDLNAGDHLCIAYGSAMRGSDELDFEVSAKDGTTGPAYRFRPRQMTADLGYLLGLYLAEGYASKKPCRTVITSGDEQIHAFLSGFGFQRKDEFHSWLFKRDFIDFMEYLGLNVSNRAWEKDIPKRFFTFSRTVQRAILQGLFDGDGSIHRDRPVVTYATTSESMARSIQRMLLPFGVVSRIYSREPVPGGVIEGREIQSRRRIFIIEISSAFYHRFMTDVGFRLSRKQERYMKGQIRGPVIPDMWKALRSTFVKAYGSRVELFRKAGQVGPDGQCNCYKKDMSVETMRAFVEAGAKLDPEILDYFYDPIVSMEDSENETYDITVPDTHSFVANGIMSHNTAFGVGNLFERRFMEAWKAKLAGKYHHRIPLFFPWYTDPKNTVHVHPEMQMSNPSFIEALTRKIFELDGTVLTGGQQFFYDQKFVDLDDEVFQFYPTEPEEAFLHSGRPVFNQEMLKALRTDYAAAPIRILDDGLEIWEEPDPSHHYGIGVDTAEGLAHGDNSVIVVVCKETGRQVAELAGKISAIDEDGLAKSVAQVARMYQNHVCIIERNNHGHTVIAYTKDDSAINLYQQEEVDSITGKTTKKIGWNTDAKSKAYAIDTLKKDLKEKTCIPRSHETYDELRTFVHGERGAMAALKGNKDDRVMSLSLANVAAKQTSVGSILIA